MIVELPCFHCQKTVKLDLPENQKEPPNVLCLECYQKLYKKGLAKRKSLVKEKHQRGFKTLFN